MTVLNAFFTSFPSVDSSPLCWEIQASVTDRHRVFHTILLFLAYILSLKNPLLISTLFLESQIPFRIIYYNEITFIINYALSQED